MTDPSDRNPQDGDELWLGLQGPIRVSDEVTPERTAWSEAARVAQAAHTVAQLSDLVTSHPDWRVRHEAVPRLRARFPGEPMTLSSLRRASVDDEPGVRLAAVHALGFVAGEDAADLVAGRLRDADFRVRLAAAEVLAFLRDQRAPLDPDAWALEGFLYQPPPELR